MADGKQEQCRILLFTGSFPPGAGGSIEYISNIFSKLPVHSAVIHTGAPRHPHAAAFDRGFPQHVVRSEFIVHVLEEGKTGKINKFFSLFQLIASGFWMIARHRPDVVHIGEYNYSFIPAILGKLVFGTPYLIYTYAEEITYLSTHRARMALFRRAIHHASAIITVSDYTRNLLVQCGADARKITKVLPSVGDSKRVVPARERIEAVRSKYNLGARKVLLTVGRLEERKGHLSVIEALPALLDIVPELLYVVVGGGPFEQRVKDQVRLTGLGDSVIFTGRAPDEEVAALYELCNVFVMPHRQLANNLDTEGCPTVFLEAGAHGKPVIGGNAGGVTDAIIDGVTGFVVDGTNASLIAEKVLLLLGDQERATLMGTAGMSYVQTLTPERNAAIINDVNLALKKRHGHSTGRGSDD